MEKTLDVYLKELQEKATFTPLSSQVIQEYKEQIQKIWKLPENYWYIIEKLVGIKTYWMNDNYESLFLYGLDTLIKGQDGYSYNPVTKQEIQDWNKNLIVIASDSGDPYCLDLSRNDMVIFTAMHGTGKWDFEIAFDTIEEFFESILEESEEDEF